ncbi:MAG: MMPL family transporter [Gemmatimonadales bacterium]
MIPLPARAIIRYRVPLIALWLIAGALAIPRAARVHQVLRVEGTALEGSDSKRALELIRASFARPTSEFYVVTLTGQLPIDSASHRALLDSLTRVAAGAPYVGQVYSYLTTRDSTLVSPDRRSSFFIAAARSLGDTSTTDLVPRFRELMRATKERISWAASYDIYVTGGPALDYDVRTVSREDAERGEEKSLPITAGVLVLAFGALVAAVLPLLVGVFAITCALALVEFVAALHPMSVFVLTIVSMVGLGVGIDYSLLIVTRFREELKRGRSAGDAARCAIDTAGKAVITSGLTVVVGFASLLVTPINETRSVGLGGLTVVAVAVLLSVTFLPAVLSLLGHAIDRPRWLARRLAWYHAPTGWQRWARWLAHHPWRALALGAIIVTAITWPLARIKIGLPRSGWFPSQTESGRGVSELARIGARGALLPVRVVLEAPENTSILSPDYLGGLRQLSDSIQSDPRVAQVRSVVDLVPGTSLLQYALLYSNLDAARRRAPEFFDSYVSGDARVTLMDVVLADTTTLTGSMDAVRHIRGVVGMRPPSLDSVKVVVGGFAASSVDLQDELLSIFPLVIALVLITTFLMLAVAFRSVLVPLKAVLMNCLSVIGTSGLTVLVFQEGVGARALRLDGPTEAIHVVVPVLVFAVVFGLSMDYGVFLLARIREAYDRSGRSDQATMEGLTATASVITSAAAIMIVVFGAFAFSHVLAAQFLGFGLAIAVLLDATLVRMVLLPALMHIAGQWNWWPGRRQPVIDEGVTELMEEVLEEPSEEPERALAPGEVL